MKHVKHIEIIRAFVYLGRDLLSFSVPGETEKIAGLHFPLGVRGGGGSVPRLTQLYFEKKKKVFLSSGFLFFSTFSANKRVFMESGHKL